MLYNFFPLKLHTMSLYNFIIAPTNAEINRLCLLECLIIIAVFCVVAKHLTGVAVCARFVSEKKININFSRQGCGSGFNDFVGSESESAPRGMKMKGKKHFFKFL
jgi:hypothetical protein